MKYLLLYWRRYRVMFLIGIFFVFVEALCELMQPRIMSSLVNKGALTGSLPIVGRYALMMFGVLAVGACSALARNWFASTVSQRFAADLRLDLFKKIQSLSADGIDSFEGGSLITRMTNDVNQIQNFANGMMRMFVKAPFLCIGAVVLSASLNLRTIAVIVPIIIVVAFTVATSMKLAYPRFGKMQAALDKLNTTMREYLAGIRLVKAFRRFKEEDTRFSVANGRLTDETIAANRILAIFSPFMALFVNTGVAVILFLGSGWVASGDMQIGEVMAFITYLAQILGSLNMISMLLNQFVRVKTSNDRISEVFETEPESEEPDSGLEDMRGFETLVFDDVKFRYRASTGEPALKGVSFTLNHGETLGVIGATGSGKSTLAALLMRFYEPGEGAISINGVPISQISKKSFRKNVAIVPQSPALFTGTVRDNLLWGKEDATEVQLRSALSSASALGFVEEKTDGMNTVIGQSGVNLSGGQKQRLSIARALTREPQLLILDDCTSALDLSTEAEVRQALFDMRLTAVLITQRISTVSKCDKILVLDAGGQAGFGTHDDLMSGCEVYRDIYISQIGGDGYE